VSLLWLWLCIVSVLTSSACARVTRATLLTSAFNQIIHAVHSAVLVDSSWSYPAQSQEDQENLIGGIRYT
jgi:hypothetical protein